MELGIADERVRNLISIGTPVGKYDFSFLARCGKPILFVHGERDEFGDVESLRRIVETISPGKAELHVIRDADHFFEGKLDELKRIISDWVTRQAGI
jgi:alpha/beta superfamily hydrolase